MKTTQNDFVPTWIDLEVFPGIVLHATKNPNKYDWVCDELPGFVLISSSDFWVKRYFPEWKLEHFSE